MTAKAAIRGGDGGDPERGGGDPEDAGLVDKLPCGGGAGTACEGTEERMLARGEGGEWFVRGGGFFGCVSGQGHQRLKKATKINRQKKIMQQVGIEGMREVGSRTKKNRVRWDENKTRNATYQLRH